MLESYLLKRAPRTVLGVGQVLQRRFFVLSGAAHARALYYFTSEQLMTRMQISVTFCDCFEALMRELPDALS